MDALFTFRIGFTSSRPIRPDEHHAWVILLGEDSPAGFIDARHTAIAMVLGAHPSEMPTSAALLSAEL